MASDGPSKEFASGWKLGELWGWMIDHGPAKVWIADSDGRILYINRRFTEITGYHPHEVLGSMPPLFKSGQMPSHVYAELWETIRAGRTWVGEIQNQRKDGSMFWEEARIIPVCDEQGNVQHFLLIGKDISDSKRVEEEAERLLAENRRLERKMMLVEQREREQLVRDLHDNMGQYLAAVKIDAVRMLTRIDEDQQAELAESARHIVANTEAVFDLVRRLSLGSQPDVIAQVGLTVALQQLAWRWQMRTGVECTMKIACELESLSDSMGTAVYSIVRESLTNVLKHADAEHVRVRIERKRSKQGHSLSVSICDDGKGISSGSSEHLGLGIIGMRERATLLGGSLRIRSDKKGVCVLVALPICDKRVP